MITQRTDNTTILIIDSDAPMRQIFRTALAHEGYTVIEASSGQDGLRVYYNSQPALVILDTLEPTHTKLEVCKRLRMVSDVPIIMLNDVTSDDDIVKGYEHGATYYILKPVKLDLVLARIRAVLNRRLEAPYSLCDFYHDDYLTIDLARRDVQVAGEAVALTMTEYSLLAYLVQNSGRTLSFSQILSHVWYDDETLKPDRVHTVIWRLRKKLEKDPKSPKYLIAEYSVGYRFESTRDVDIVSYPKSHRMPQPPQQFDKQFSTEGHTVN